MRTPIAFLWISMLGPASASAQSTVDGQALLLLALDAHGGEQALRKFSQTRATGRLRIYGSEVRDYAVDVRTRGADQVWVRRSGGRGVRLYVANGRAGWVVENGAKRSLPARIASNRPLETNPAIGILATALDGLLTVGETTVVEAPTLQYLVDVTLPRRDPGGEDPLDLERKYRLRLDAETLLVTGLEIFSFSSDGRPLPQVQRIEYSDYRDVDGLRAPFRIRRYLSDTLHSEWTLDSFVPAAHQSSLFAEP